MNVDIRDGEYVLVLSRSEFFLLTDALEEHLLLRGERFDVAGYGRAAARAFASELAKMTLLARGAEVRGDEGE
ncbi:hypothetical protein [Promicromonospora sp. NPDC023805]|uniref:hypothetical protein n=1 Tax=Promicromonospora sp. NPDC023805 TaxID=3154696 RepID=UPI0033C0456C